MNENEIRNIIDEAVAKNCTVYMSYTDGKISSVHISPPEDELNAVLHVREVAADICEIFEDLLDEFGIMIPSKLREGDEDEACLFGEEYIKVEDAVTNRLVNLISNVKECPNVLIDTVKY